MKSNFDIKKLVRPNIAELQPYSSARDEYVGEANIFLDANENSLGSAVQGKFNRYPDPKQWELKEKLARIKKVKPSQIFFGNGSDEAIDLLYRAFCEPQKDSALIFPPTYGMYKVQANIHNSPVVEIPLNEDFSLPVEKIIQIINPAIKMMFICSPNNPTGNLIRKKDILTILDCFKGLVVVDEAYIDFSNADSMLSEIENYGNLVVLQTFSKAWGMAGLRLGMAFAQAETIEILNKIKYPYNINQVTQEYVIKALSNLPQKEDMVNTLLQQRKVLEEKLSELEIVEKIYPSDANFILVKTLNAPAIYNDLIKSGIIVRNRSNVNLCNNCLRITVGTASENEQLIEQLAKIGAGLFKNVTA